MVRTTCSLFAVDTWHPLQLTVCSVLGLLGAVRARHQWMPRAVLAERALQLPAAVVPVGPAGPAAMPRQQGRVLLGAVSPMAQGKSGMALGEMRGNLRMMEFDGNGWLSKDRSRPFSEGTVSIFWNFWN